ncbi:MAG: hypothetical protein ACTTH7_10085, partial [Treponema sp.]
MNEKRFFNILLACMLLFFLSCCCTKGGLHGNGSGAYRVREHSAELAAKQTESAITSEKLNGTLERAREQSEILSSELTASRQQGENLSRSITSGTAELDRLAEILQHIRARNSSGTGSKAD